MLYLIESGNYYKIGFSDNIEARMKQYSTHNPEFKLIDTCEGTKKEESLLHELCSEYKYSTEWFNKSKDVLLIWATYKIMSIKVTDLQQIILEKEKRINSLKSTIEDLSKQLDIYNVKQKLDIQNVDVIKGLKQQMKQIMQEHEALREEVNRLKVQPKQEIIID